jgi:hypothetical protein
LAHFSVNLSLLIMVEQKTRIIILSLLCGLSVSVTAVFYFIYLNHQKPGGGFTRNVVTGLLTDTIVVELPFNSYYFAGVAGKTLYLGNETAPTHILLVNERILVSALVQAPAQRPRATRIRIDSPYFYIEDLERFTIHSGDISTLQLKGEAIQSAFFSEAVPLSPNSIVQRTISDHASEYALSKLTNSKHTYGHNLLEKQVDGLFCTDGVLHFDKNSQRLTYVYFYRNEFICADTNLNLEFRQNTIDTISRARVTAAKLSKEDAMILSAPPFIVNRRSTTFADMLFVNSNILSDSDANDITEQNAIIDVYNLDKKGIYSHSFYLPNYRGHKMKHFAVYDDNLFSIHDRFLIRYRIQTKM